MAEKRRRKGTSSAPAPMEGPSGQVRSRKQFILDAALELFGTRGYDVTTIDDIGEAVGISGPAIYRHFASKEEILVTAFEDAGRELIEAYKESRKEPDPYRAVDILFRGHASMAVRKGPWVRIWLRDGHRLPAQWALQTQQVQKGYLSWLAELVQRLRPELSKKERHETVHAMAGMFNGAPFYKSALREDERIEFLVETAHVVLAGAPAVLEPKAIS